MEDKDPDDNSEETREDPDDVPGRQPLPLLEQHGGGEDDARREEHIVDGGDQRGVEDVEGLQVTGTGGGEGSDGRQAATLQMLCCLPS